MELLLQCNPLERQSCALAFVPVVRWLRRYLTEFQLVALKRRRFDRSLDEPKFSELFMADLLSRNSRIEEDLIDQLFNSSEKRLARVLLLLANFGQEATVEPIVGNFSQETLAVMIGTTRSRVSFFSNKFRKLGYIKYNGKLEINNSLLNVVLYDKLEIRKHDGSEGTR
jgi:CRP/FNR family cyclic AMP-dependent transcriptional regulator